MLNHFLRLLGRACESYPSLLGGNWVSLFLPAIIYILVLLGQIRQGGIAAMKNKIGLDTKLLASAYALLFVWAVVNTTYRDHIDLAAFTQKIHGSFVDERAKREVCASDLSKANATIGDKQGLVDTLQKTMIAAQAPQQQQAANIASCINNLAKMNPIIREQISVIPVQFGTQSATSHVNDPKGLIIGYLFELFIITNEPERIFNGDLKCNKDFTIINPPQINPRETVSFLMRGGNPPKMISAKEYLITVDSTGTEWNPSHPAYMSIRTTETEVGCSFTPQE